MLSFFKKRKITDNLPGDLPFTLDIHSHILPRIDDGAADIASHHRHYKRCEPPGP